MARRWHFGDILVAFSCYDVSQRALPGPMALTALQHAGTEEVCARGVAI